VLPDIRPDEPAIVIAGYPNVGKSSFVNRVTRASNQIAEYPFTTKGVQIGHFERDHVRYQIVDTPGLLDRPEDERNDIERQAVSALEHLADVVVFVLDPPATAATPQCPARTPRGGPRAVRRGRPVPHGGEQTRPLRGGTGGIGRRDDERHRRRERRRRARHGRRGEAAFEPDLPTRDGEEERPFISGRWSLINGERRGSTEAPHSPKSHQLSAVSGLFGGVDDVDADPHAHVAGLDAGGGARTVALGHHGGVGHPIRRHARVGG